MGDSTRKVSRFSIGKWARQRAYLGWSPRGLTVALEVELWHVEKRPAVITKSRLILGLRGSQEDSESHEEERLHGARLEQERQIYGMKVGQCDFFFVILDGVHGPRGI